MPSAHLFPFPNHPYLLTHLPHIISSVLQLTRLLVFRPFLQVVHLCYSQPAPVFDIWHYVFLPLWICLLVYTAFLCLTCNLVNFNIALVLSINLVVSVYISFEGENLRKSHRGEIYLPGHECTDQNQKKECTDFTDKISVASTVG